MPPYSRLTGTRATPGSSSYQGPAEETPAQRQQREAITGFIWNRLNAPAQEQPGQSTKKTRMDFRSFLGDMGATRIPPPTIGQFPHFGSYESTFADQPGAGGATRGGTTPAKGGQPVRTMAGGPGGAAATALTGAGGRNLPPAPSITQGGVMSPEQLSAMINRVSGQGAAATRNAAAGGNLPPTLAKALQTSAAAANRAMGSDVNANARLSMALPNAQQQLAGEALRSSTWNEMMSADLRQQDLALKKWAADVGLQSGKEQLGTGMALDQLQLDRVQNQNMAPLLAMMQALYDPRQVQQSQSQTAYYNTQPRNL